MSGKLAFSWKCAGAALAAFAVSGAPGLAQISMAQTVNGCAGLSGAEEISCLRAALTQTQDALTLAEQALEAAERVQPAPEQATLETLGAEQTARRAGILPASSRTERLTALIVASERTHPNRLQVLLENGQIWRQIQGDTQIVELDGDVRTAAEIWSSGFGGYRLRLPDIGRTLKVERVH